MKNNGISKYKYKDNVYYCKEFINSYYSSTLKYRASDLLSLGLNPNDLDIALNKALTACKTAGRPIRKHFLPIYTSSGDQLIRDCKLSKMAYALVLLNAKVNNASVAAFQVKIIADYLNE